MSSKQTGRVVAIVLTLTCFAVVMWMAPTGHAQLPDKTVTPNAAGVGINKSFAQQAGAGRGNVMTPDSSSFIIERDPFRAIRRGRQLFQRQRSHSAPRPRGLRGAQRLRRAVARRSVQGP